MNVYTYIFLDGAGALLVAHLEGSLVVELRIYIYIYMYMYVYV